MLCHSNGCILHLLTVSSNVNLNLGLKLFGSLFLCVSGSIFKEAGLNTIVKSCSREFAGRTVNLLIVNKKVRNLRLVNTGMLLILDSFVF